MLLLDEEGAVRAIPAMLPEDREQREQVFAIIREIVLAAGRAERRAAPAPHPCRRAFRGRSSQTRGGKPQERSGCLILILGGCERISMGKETIENRTFDEIQIGDSATLTRTLSEQDINLFAAASGDLNPTHLDSAYMKKSGRGGVVGHSLWGGALISSLLGNVLPGPGTVYRRQDLRFLRPVFVGDTASVTITVTDKKPKDNSVAFDCRRGQSTTGACTERYG